MSTSLIKIFPCSISLSLNKTFAIVDFPEPVAPTMASLSPAFIENEIFFKICFSAPLYLKQTLSKVKEILLSSIVL